MEKGPLFELHRLFNDIRPCVVNWYGPEIRNNAATLGNDGLPDCSDIHP